MSIVYDIEQFRLRNPELDWETEPVFVYGILLRGLTLEDATPAYVPDHALRFYAFASCEEAEGERCYGAIVNVPRWVIRDRLDRIEGCADDPSSPDGLYRRVKVMAVPLAGSPVEVWIYKGNEMLTRHGTDDAWRFEGMKDTYRKLGLPVSALFEAMAGHKITPFAE